MTTHFGPPINVKLTWEVPQPHTTYYFNSSSTVEVGWDMIDDLQFKNTRKALKVIEHDLMDEMTCPCPTCQQWRVIHRKGAA